ncbi:MAG TPA: tetratricopeptide repeat protein [Hyphomicrobiaceae bacterium]|nr:tetratricopeptide repeat protein [Hyphomicrobiaceae bacterium]
MAYRKAGDVPRAIEDFSAAILLNPVYAVAYANRGYAYETQGKRAEAIQDLQRALLFDPSHIGARDGLARLRSSAPLAEEAAKRVGEGAALVETHCKSCHAIGREGASPKAGAPAFRTLHARHPMEALREPLTRAIAAPHDEMPKFVLADDHIDRIVAYINSLDGAN